MSSYEEFFRKLFFRKVQMILNIFIYYGFFISHIVLELSAIENSHEMRFLRLNSLQKVTFRVSGIDSRFKIQKRFSACSTFLDWSMKIIIYSESAVVFAYFEKKKESENDEIAALNDLTGPEAILIKE